MIAPDTEARQSRFASPAVIAWLQFSSVSPDLHESWQRVVRRDPAAPAVIDRQAGVKWTRHELEEAAAALAAVLAENSGLRRRRAVMALPNGHEWLRVFIALLKCGAIPVPVDPGEPSHRMINLAEKAGAAWLWDDGRLRFLRARRPARRRDACLVKLTSGSTGAPRAFEFTHAQMIADGRQICSSMRIKPSDLNLGVIPFGHSYGLGNLVMPLLIQGTPVVAASGALPAQIADDCRETGVTVFPAVPALLRVLAESAIETSSLRSLRLVISAGSMLPADVARTFLERFGVAVHAFYGSSETGGICYDRSGRSTLAGTSVGAPLDGVELTFLSGGRFRVTSPAVYGRGFFSPKDRGALNDRDELQLLGRVGRMAKVAGRRVDLCEIEGMMRSVPGVSDAYVVEHPLQPDRLVAVAATVRRPIELRRAMAATCASWKIPERIVAVERFPLTSRGKADTKKLREIVSQRITV